VESGQLLFLLIPTLALLVKAHFPMPWPKGSSGLTECQPCQRIIELVYNRLSEGYLRNRIVGELMWVTASVSLIYPGVTFHERAN
jgi:hypothetical protein